MRKKFFFILFFFFLLLGGYWIKCQLRINLFRDFAWEKHFLFLQALQRQEYVASPRPGVLLLSSFDGWWPYQPWIDLWAREEGRVKEALVRDPVRGSRCLQVCSNSPHDWGINHAFVFEVAPGEEFAFEGNARTTGSAVAQMSVVTYDAQRKPLSWLFALENVRSPDWVRVSRRFMVPSGVKYIRFRLTGGGLGDAYFDDIRFVKEK